MIQIPKKGFIHMVMTLLTQINPRSMKNMLELIDKLNEHGTYASKLIFFFFFYNLGLW